MFNRKAKQQPIIWQAPINEKEKLTCQDAKFIFDQAEKYLCDTVDTSETIVSRVNTFITIITGSLIAFITFDISRLGKGFIVEPVLLTALLGTVYLYILAWYSFSVNYPADYIIAGSLPKDLYNESFFSEAIEKEDRLRIYYLNEIEQYQFRIEVNSRINNSRWKAYTRISVFLILLPIVLILTYLLTYWGFSHCSS
jgi:hypothetical protein